MVRVSRGTDAGGSHSTSTNRGEGGRSEPVLRRTVGHRTEQGIRSLRSVDPFNKIIATAPAAFNSSSHLFGELRVSRNDKSAPGPARARADDRAQERTSISEVFNSTPT